MALSSGKWRTAPYRTRSSLCPLARGARAGRCVSPPVRERAGITKVWARRLSPRVSRPSARTQLLRAPILPRFVSKHSIRLPNRDWGSCDQQSQEGCGSASRAQMAPIRCQCITAKAWICRGVNPAHSLASVGRLSMRQTAKCIAPNPSLRCAHANPRRSSPAGLKAVSGWSSWRQASTWHCV
jgi:hypothetical protein